MGLSACKPQEAPNASINGTWTSLGSGWYLTLTDSTHYALYDFTEISCFPVQKGEFSTLSPDLSKRGDTLLVKRGVITHYFVRSEELPALCTATISEEKANSILFNFEVFAQTVKEHYAFMALNQIDWPRLYEQQKQKLINSPSEVALYQIIDETLSLLNDNHAYLEADESVYEALEKLEEEMLEEDDKSALPEYGDFQIAAMVAKHHLQEEQTKDSWLIQWGKLTDEIGYIQVKGMWLYADLEIPQALIDSLGYVDAYVTTFHSLYVNDYFHKEVQGVKEIMDRAMLDLANTKSLVVDVRFNGGGQDGVSFEILSRFLPERKQIATQQLSFRGEKSPLLPLYIEGVQNAYTKPVYVLTSPQTGSAAEAFSIATMSIDNMKRIGSATSGAMSTSLDKKLPNGWAFSLSNEIYMDNQGVCYENKGIPVDYELNYPKDRQDFFRQVASQLEEDKASILKAIDALSQ